jgi:hypothetical protein
VHPVRLLKQRSGPPHSNPPGVNIINGILYMVITDSRTLNAMIIIFISNGPLDFESITTAESKLISNVINLIV